MGQACITEKIERHIEGLPTLETSRMRIFQVLQREDSTLEGIEQVISGDPAMAAKVIKLANSSFYRHTERHAGIQQALRTIGLDMVKCVALSMAVMETFGSETASMKDLWGHSHAVAFVSGLFGDTRSEKEGLFTGGLLHDLGRMVFVCTVPDEYLALREFTGYWPDPGLEKDVLSVDHTVIGEMVAVRWHFPPEVIRVIRHHHDPVDRMSALVCLTDQVISAIEQKKDFDEFEHEASLKSYLGEEYKGLVNAIRQRYTTNTAIVENLG